MYGWSSAVIPMAPVAPSWAAVLPSTSPLSCQCFHFRGDVQLPCVQAACLCWCVALSESKGRGLQKTSGGL